MNKSADLTSALLKLTLEAAQAHDEFMALRAEDFAYLPARSKLETHLSEVIFAAATALHILREGRITQ